MEFIAVTEWGKKKLLDSLLQFSLLNNILICNNQWEYLHFCISISTAIVQKDCIYFLFIQITVAAWTCIFRFKQEYVPSLHSSLQLQTRCCLSRFARFQHLTELYFFLWVWHNIAFAFKNHQNFKPRLARHIIMRGKKWKLYEQQLSQSLLKCLKNCIETLSKSKYIKNWFAD